MILSIAASRFFGFGLRELFQTVIACILLLNAPAVPAQVWIGPGSGDWYNQGNWTGLQVLGNEPNETSFNRGAIAIINGPLSSEEEGSITYLHGKLFSIGNLIVDVNGPVRFDSQKKAKLVFDHPLNSILFARDGGFKTGENVTIELRDNNMQPTLAYVADGVEIVMDGSFSGVGGMNVVESGMILLNGMNTHPGMILINTGTLEVSKSGGIARDVRVAAGGSFINNGGVLAGALGNHGGNVTLRGGSYGGGINNINGMLSVEGTLTGANPSIFNDDSMQVTGVLNLGGGNLANKRGGRVTLGADLTGISTLSMAGFVSTADPGLTPTLSATRIVAAPGAVFDLRGDNVVGKGMIIDAEIIGTARVTMANGVLRGVEGAATSVVEWTRGLPGDATALVLDFGMANDAVVKQGLQIPLLKITPASFSRVATTGLPQTASLVSAFFSYDDKTSTFNLMTTTNPALGGVVSTLALVDGLIGAAVNRPLDAFVGQHRLTSECNRGAWVGQVGGRARSTTTTDSLLGGGGRLSLPNEVTLSYHGLQGGFDFGCYPAPYGLNLAAGIMLGSNNGRSLQNLFNFTVDPVTGDRSILTGPGNLLSVTSGDFRQSYGGTYLAAARGDWFSEIQIRRELTRYNFNSHGVDGAALALNNGRLTNTGNTLSANLSRAFQLRDGLLLTPTTGFRLTQTSGSTLDFVNEEGVVVGTLRTAGHTNRIVYVGTGLQSTELANNGLSVTKRFVSATVYGDLSPARRAQFSQSEGSNPFTLSTAPQGHFGEISMGLSHSRTFRNKGGLNILDVSLRGEMRVGSNSSSSRIAAQMRWQF